MVVQDDPGVDRQQIAGAVCVQRLKCSVLLDEASVLSALLCHFAFVPAQPQVLTGCNGQEAHTGEREAYDGHDHGCTSARALPCGRSMGLASAPCT